jgi:hypothetical protein
LASEVGEALRRLVADRAHGCCEYCLLSEEDAYFPHQVDHIVSRKHGGTSEPDNLAFACLRCNVWKGSDIGSIDSLAGAFVRFFHPRRQNWSDHFQFRGAVIEPLTSDGRVPCQILRLNLDKRVAERRLLMAVGRYPILKG